MTLNKKLGISHQIKLCGFRVLLLYPSKIPANSGCCVVPFLHRISQAPNLSSSFGPRHNIWAVRTSAVCAMVQQFGIALLCSPTKQPEEPAPSAPANITQHRCQVVISVSVRRRVRVNHATSCRKIQSRS